MRCSSFRRLFFGLALVSCARSSGSDATEQPGAHAIATGVAANAAAVAPRQRAMTPSGPLPQHRGWFSDPGARDIQRSGADWWWQNATRVRRRSGTDTKTVYDAGAPIRRLEVGPGGRFAVLVDDTLRVVAGGKVLHSIATHRYSTFAWCDERLFVAGAELSEVVDGKLVPAAAVEGQLSRHSCAAGILAVRVRGGVRRFDVGSGEVSERWDVPLPSQEGLDHVAVSPDGLWIAAKSSTSAVWLWDAEGREQARWPSLGHRSHSLAFSPDGRVLAVGPARLSVPDLQLIGRWSANGELCDWSSDGQQLVLQVRSAVVELDLGGLDRIPLPRGLSETPRAMAIDRDRNRLYTSEEGGQILEWSLDTLEVRRGFDNGGHFDGGSRLEALPDGTLLVGAGAGLMRWSADGRSHENILLPWPGGASMSVSADGRWVATTGSNHVYVVDWTKGLSRTLGPYRDDQQEFDGSAESVSLRPQGDVVAVGGRSRTHVVALDDGQTVAELSPLEGYGNEVFFSADGNRLLHTTSLGARLYAWPERTPVELPAAAQGADAATVSPDGETLIVSNWRGTVAAIDLSPKPKLRWERDAPWHVGAHAVDFGRKRVITGGPDLDLIVWSLEDGERLEHRAGGAGPQGTAVALSDDGRYVAVGNDAGAVFLFDRTTGERVREWSEPESPRIERLAVTNAADVTAFAGGQTLRLPAEGSPQRTKGDTGEAGAPASDPKTLEKHPVPEGVWPMAASRTYLAGMADGLVVVSRIEDGEVVHVFAGHEGRIDAVSFGGDGRTLASLDTDGIVWLWDLRTGAAVMRLLAATGAWNTWRADGRWREGGYGQESR